ncbi:hypothetical protein KSS87_018167 [Heliosperma pusillum]|nr:hypothetical protein KSS87_018167 [Heliosperma pusillum]
MASENLRLPTLRSKIAEFTGFLANPTDDSLLSPSDSDKLLQQFVLAFQTKANEIVAEHADVANFNDDHLDAYMDRLRAELKETEAESASMSQEVEKLTDSYVEGICRLESNLQSLRHAVDCAESKGSGHAEAGEQVGKHLENDGYHKFAKTQHVDSFEAEFPLPFQMSKLKHQIEMNEVTLKSFQELDLELKRVEAVEKINEALTGFKVIDVEGNSIRLSLTTYIPYVEVLMSTKPSEVNHELLIEVLNGTMEIERVEIFPDDVHICEIVEAANTFSKLFWGLQETRSTLGWFLQKVQDRIVMCTLRQLVVKNANNSRHSFEYLDKDESVIAHMTGGTDAYLKPSQDWPLSGSELKLVSLRSSDQNAKEISLSLLSKVEVTVCVDVKASWFSGHDYNFCGNVDK